ncbi:MAG: cation:proton antiporter [Candidatus Heimdallarchaeaceae archaeon]
MSFHFIIFLYIGFSILIARIFGELFEKLKLSSIIGELFAGLLLGGPIFFLFGIEGFSLGENFTFSFIDMAEGIEPFAQVGILLLLFIVGSEIKTSELKKAGKRNILISLTDVTITYGLGLLVGYFLIGAIFGERNIGVAAFFALIFVPTSIGTTVRTLSNLKKLNSKEGQTLLSLAVFDDFLAMLLLLIVSGIVFSGSSGTGLGLVWDIVIQVGFIVILVVVILYLLPKLVEFLENRFRVFSVASTSYLFVGILFGLLLVIAFFAEYLGISAAIGAFLLGIGMQRVKFLMKEPLETFIKFGEGSLIPLFFFSVGSSFILVEFNYIYLVIIPLVIIAKMIGSFTGAMFSINPLRDRLITSIKKTRSKSNSSGSKNPENDSEKKGITWENTIKPNIISSGKISLGMMPKGEITLVIAAIGLTEVVKFSTDIQELAGDLYSITILIVLVTVFLTPILLRMVFRDPKPKKEIENGGEKNGENIVQEKNKNKVQNDEEINSDTN